MGTEALQGRDGRGVPPTPTASVDLSYNILRGQLTEAWREIQTLRRTVAHQARLLEHLHAETHPAAPSLNCVYWLFSLAHEHEQSWRWHWNALQHSLRGLGTLPAPEVTPQAWARHLAARRHELGPRGKGPCDHSLNVELSRLKSMLDWAVVNQMITSNPLRSVKRLKTVSRRETKLVPYDVDRLLAAAEDVTDKRLADGDDDGVRARKLQAFILCCFDSMLRSSEAHALDRDAISPEGDVEVLGKGKKLRTVRLTERTREAIRSIPGQGRVFTEARCTLNRWFRWASAHSRVDAKKAPRDSNVVFHTLRHAGATEADAAGVRPSALSLTLGHASLETTEIYLHRDAMDAAREVAEAMERRPPQRVAKSKKVKRER